MLELQRNVVAVVPLFDPDVSEGGIIIPDQAKGRCTQGIVKYLGPKCKTVKVADHVLFSAYTGTTIQLEGEGSVLIFLREDTIEAVIESPNTEVPGVYFKDKDGYFTATYEQILTLMAQALNEDPTVMKSLRAHFRRALRSPIPELASYNVPEEENEG